MITPEDLEKYKFYLGMAMNQLNTFFEEQKPYLCCKEGCSHCCEKGEYPFSELEFAYLIIATKNLAPETVKEIENNIINVKKDKENYTSDKPFMYKCPFLINNRCSVYENRGIICRTHGIAFFTKENKLKLPACSKIGLNYANVLNPETNEISSELFKKLNIEQEPLAHNVGLHFMTHNETVKNMNLNFGEIKALR